MEISKNNHRLLQHDVPVCVFHELMRFTVSPVLSLSNPSLVEGRIKNLARLDACVATTLTYLRDDASGKVGGHPQKLYNEKFPVYLPVSFVQITQKVGARKEDWCPEELNVSSFLVYALKDPA